MRLEVNVADLTKIPSFVAQILLKQPDMIEIGTECVGKTMGECVYIVTGPKEKVESIAEILNKKGVRSEIKKEAWENVY